MRLTRVQFTVRGMMVVVAVVAVIAALIKVGRYYSEPSNAHYFIVGEFRPGGMVVLAGLLGSSMIVWRWRVSR